MALIGTLRNKMGTWVVVFVFVAIVAFILNDLLGNNSILFGDDREIGEIAGTSISYDEFQQVVEEREANYYLNFGRQPTDKELPTIRQQAWELLILRHAIRKEYDKVGVQVTTEELEDMIYGKNVDQSIAQAFTNPETGQLDKARIRSYLSELRNQPSDPQQQQVWLDQRNRWEVFQRDLVPSRERIKYENLLLKTNFVTSAEAARDYHAQTDVNEVRFLYIPYYAVSDSAAVPSDSDLKDFYEKNKERYKTEEGRDIKFVSFPVTPTSDDSLEIRADMEQIAKELKETTEDSTFAVANADSEEAAFGTYNPSSLPAVVQSEDLRQGNVIGPFVDGNAYKVVKVTAVTTDTVFSARASHILIRWENETDAAKKAAKEKARNILKDIKGGADFAAKAREFGTDGTARTGGDLGWFSSGRMVKPFETAVFAATRPGLLNDVVETSFGYHIIKVTSVKTNASYKIAIVDRNIGPSNETINSAYRKAEMFAADLSGADQFTEKAKKEGYTVLEEKDLRSTDRRVGNSGDARQIVQWAFRDASMGDVSEVFDLQTEYIVAVLTGESKKGYRTFESVKTDITPEVRKEIKGKQIIEKLKGMDGTLEEVALKFGEHANVYHSSDLKLNSNSLPTAGFDPKAIGVAYSLENGKKSAPFAGENGVFIVEVQNKTAAPEMNDYTTFKTKLEENIVNRAGFAIAEAIKEYAKIEDKRYKFY
jgi:peptidyl-prolyl cis-trans isomerase D